MKLEEIKEALICLHQIRNDAGWKLKDLDYFLVENQPVVNMKFWL